MSQTSDTDSQLYSGRSTVISVNERTGTSADAAVCAIESAARPGLVNLIQRQRLRFITDGSFFPKYSAKGLRASFSDERLY